MQAINIRRQSGFTLVEIAIVLVIIGLLLGGVLKGQELITQAKIKNVANDFNGLTAAVYSYQDRYKRLPGDDPGMTRWSVAGAALTAAQSGDGNNVIGTAGQDYQSTTDTTENRKFWLALRLAGFVAGTTASIAEGSAQPINAAGGIVGVQSGKYNAGMSSFTINAEREKQVNMVSYFDAGTMWAVPTGNPGGVTVEDPCGKNIAVQKATVQAEEIEATDKKCQADGKAAINIQPYNLQSDATTAVVSGKSDAMLADSPVTAYAIQQSGGKLEQLGDIYGTAPYGVVVAKDQTEFADAISGAINELIADGTYQQILDNWGVGSGAISKSVVNPPVTES